jgi:DNA-binding response OmpR family regulator
MGATFPGHTAPRILIVDDHAGYRTALGLALARSGYDVVELDCGSGVPKLARALRPDAVILDLDLPDVPGGTVCAQLKAQPETRMIPVIIATGRGTEQDRVDGFEAGADDFVVKPFSVRELVLRLRVLVGRRPALPIGVMP